MATSPPSRVRTGLGSLIVLLLILWLGFVVHRSPRFPGSLTGGVLGISGASLIVLFSIAYMAIKRIPGLSRKLAKRVSMQTLMNWHVYTGVVGAILVLLHTGHRFQSNLGIALTTLMLLTTLSGYVGARLKGRVSLELREKQDLLSQLETSYNAAVGELARNPVIPAIAAPGILTLLRSRFAQGASETPAQRAVQLAESIAEIEYSIKAHERLKRLYAAWLNLHIATALAFYLLLGLHIWAAIHFGLRWFQ